jgi:hypothetical protein
MGVCRERGAVMNLPTMSGARRSLVGVAAGALLSIGLLAGCGGSSSGGKAAATSPPAFSDAAAQAQITANWQTFFDAAKAQAARAAVLQDASTLGPVIAAQANNPQAKGTTAVVKKVVVDPSHTSATVTYDIYINGKPSPLVNATGTAVYDSGTWKVSKASFCGLIALQVQAAGSTPPPECAGS